MKLVVGLGNAGRKYEGTRHNVGFDVLTELARRTAGGAAKDKFEGRTMEVTLGDERCLLLWPYTLMNRSGRSVAAAARFYQLDVEKDLLVVCDDFNLPLGKLRFRSQGSAGGQNGLQDVIQRLGTQEFSRLRIGIGPVPASWDAADFVLGRFGKAEQPEAELAIVRAADGVECWVEHGITEGMNRFN